MLKFTACKRTTVDVAMIERSQNMLDEVQEKREERVQIFSLLGNEVRFKIIFLLLKVERLCVCDIADILHMKQSPISQHLRKLKDANVLTSKREGMTIYYSITSSKKALLLALILE